MVDRCTTVRAAIALALLGPLLVGVAGPGAAPATAAVTPVTNPQITEKCGVDLTLVLDASGSVQQSNAVNQVRDAAEAFLDALSNTGSSARVTQFATVSEQLAPSTVVDDDVAGAGRHPARRDRRLLQPHPTPSGGRQLLSDDPRTRSTQQRAQQQPVHQLGPVARPGRRHHARPGRLRHRRRSDGLRLHRPGPVRPGRRRRPSRHRSAVSSRRHSTLDRAVEEANRIKTAGSPDAGGRRRQRAEQPRASANGCRQISGPQVVRDADLADVDSLNEVDVALVTDFEDLAAFMRDVVLQLCSPSLTIRKLAQTADDADVRAGAGLGHDRDPDACRRQRLPLDPPRRRDRAPRRRWRTDTNGFAQFQWEPDPPEADSAATVSEALQPGYIAGQTGTGRTTSSASSGRGRQRAHRRRASSPATRPTRRSTSTRSGRRSSPARSTTPSTTHPAIALTKVNAPDRGARRPRPAGDGDVDLRGHQPRQHTARQRLASPTTTAARSTGVPPAR